MIRLMTIMGTIALICSGCTTTAPDYFEGWRSHRVEWMEVPTDAIPAPFDLREGATVE